MRTSPILNLLLLSLCLPSCSNLGSIVLPPDRLAFNRSLSRSDEQQNLLNIVRLRYTDPPYFLSVNSVVSQFTFSRAIGVNLSNAGIAALMPALIGSGNANYNVNEAPTITYTPLQGPDFLNLLLTPIDLETLYRLFRSGWSVHHVSRIIIQRFADVDNASLASRSISHRIPVYKQFRTLLAVFRHLQNDNNVVINNDQINGVFAIRFAIKNYNLLNEKERVLLSKYNVSASSPNIWFVSVAPKNKHQVYIETRTVLGVLNYLSKGVDVPANDVINKQADMTTYPDKKIFDWHAVTEDIMRVRSSKSKPKHPFVAVKYRGSWFYIPEDDFQTKETLNLLAIIIGVYQGNIKAALPVLTVS